MTAPSLIDPHLPEWKRLRAAATVLDESFKGHDRADAVLATIRMARLRAARLESEDVDRTLAAEKAKAHNPDEWATLPLADQESIIDMILTGIRAADERAGRTDRGVPAR